MKLIYIEWVDAFQYGDSWTDIEEVKERAKTDDWVVHECGWVVEETKEYILLASAWFSDGTVGGVTKIPSTWVRRRINLSIKPKGR